MRHQVFIFLFLISFGIWHANAEGEYNFPNDNDEVYVYVTQGNKFNYFWNHPFHATRISMRLGILGIIFGVLGYILSICFKIF